MKRVVLYPRVSTKGQAEDGYSLNFQVEKMINYCKAMDYAVVGIYSDDGYSGSNLERPGIKRIIEESTQDKFDAVIVYKLDRLSRSQKHTMYMLEDVFIPNDIAFISMSEAFDTSTQFGIAMVGILSVFAQLERENIKQRTFDGRKGRAKEGKWHGGNSHPIGYDYIEGELVINDKEAEQVRRVYELYANGTNITEICRQMDGYETKHGDWHHPQTVANVLDNPLYVGTVHFDDVTAPDSHTAIVSKELNDTVKAMRTRELKYGTKKDSKYMLSGLVYCKNCGARYFVKKNPNKNLFYCCHSRAKVNKAMIKDATCKNRNWRKDDLEKAVYNEIKRLADNPHLLYELKKKPSAATDGDNNEQVRGEIDDVNKDIGKLMDLYQANDRLLQVDDIAKKIDALYQKKIGLLQQIEPKNSTINRHTKVFDIERARLIILDLPAAMQEDNIDMVRYFLMCLLDKIEIDGDNLQFHWSFVD